LSGWIEIRSPVSKPVQAALNEEDAMHYLALATDYEGTIADDGVVDKPTLVALVSCVNDPLDARDKMRNLTSGSIAIMCPAC
jgi:hypothetical protein